VYVYVYISVYMYVYVYVYVLVCTHDSLEFRMVGGLPPVWLCLSLSTTYIVYKVLVVY
jgi:hypothetical protein